MGRGALVSKQVDTGKLLAWLTLLLALAGSMTPAFAAQERFDPARQPKPLSTFYREVWTTRQGLPHNQVNTMAQTPDGYLWLGTWEGIVRYDGIDFQVYDRSNTPELKDNGIRSLEVAPDGSLVVGTSRGGVTIKRGNHWKTLLEADGLGENGVMDALVDRRGRLWVASDSHGITRFEHGKATRLDAKSGDLPSDIMYSLAIDTDGSVWAATARGLVHFTEADGTILAAGSGLPNAPILHLTMTGKGELLVGTEQGAYRRIGKSERFELLSALLPKDSTPSLNQDSTGNLWVGTTNNGLYRLSKRGVEQFTSASSLPNNRIASLLVDRENTLWVGTNAGLLHLADTPFTSWGRGQGMSDSYVRTLLPASDGSVWIGTGRGLNQWRDQQIVASYTKADGLPGDSILSLLQARDGSLLVGTYSDGLLRLRGSKVVQRFDSAGGMPGNDQVRAIAEQADGTLWIGTTRGLVRWQDGRYRLYGLADGLPREFITALHIARDGALWVGTSNGAAVLRDGRPQDGRFQAVDIAAVNDSKDAFAFLEDPDGTLWIVTDRGLIRWRAGKMHSVGIEQGLPLDTFFGIVDDHRGSFWLSSNRGVLRVARKQVEAVMDGRQRQLPADHFGEADGLASAQCNGGSSPSAALDAAGNVWVATASGASMVNPEILRGSRLPLPRVVLEQVLADDVVIDTPDNGRLELPPGTRKLEFRYAAISFLIPRFLRYRHRLEGVDATWVDGGDRRVAQFTNLSPGSYQFAVEVSAPGLGQGWEQVPTILQIDISPRLWQRPEFILAITALVLVLLGSLYRWRHRSLRQRAALLEQVVAQRTRDLQDNAERLRLVDKERSSLLERLREQSQAFERMALEDSLTRISNRRNMEVILAATFAGAVAGNRPLSFALFDVDLFKQINDLYSHESGDQALVDIANTLRETLGSSGSIARWGGEEFAVLMPDMGLNQAMALCERLRAAVEAIDCSGYAPGARLTISAGVVDRTGINHHEKLVSHADRLMYMAKSAGRNRICG